MAKQKIAVGVALTGFDHHGTKRRGQTIYNTDYSQETLKQLVQAGFVELKTNSTKAEQEAKEKAEQEANQPDEKGEDADPEQGAGEQSSASPVAPASQEQTAKESDSGEKKKGGKKKK